MIKALVHQGVDRGRGQRNSGHGAQHLGGALKGQQMVLRQVDRQCRHPRPILHRGRDVGGKGTTPDLAADAHAGHGAILGHFAADHQISDLAALG
jgi:hypothetical protein